MGEKLQSCNILKTYRTGKYQSGKTHTQSSKQIVGKGLEQTFHKRRYPAATPSPKET